MPDDPRPPRAPPKPPPPPQRAVPRPPPSPQRAAPQSAEGKTGIFTNDSGGEYHQSLASLAQQLREEQLKARVIYVDPSQQTNEELDAITENVIAELRALQHLGIAIAGDPSKQDHSVIEKELSTNLRAFLDKLLSNRRRNFRKSRVAEIQRRITALFFNSELHSKIKEARPEKTRVGWPSQALYVTLKRHEAALFADLHLLQYTNSTVREEALRRFNEFTKELQIEYLSATTPELEQLLKVFRDQLANFFRVFRKDLKEFSEHVIKTSSVARGNPTGYKIRPEAFGVFRETFDRSFLDALEVHLQVPLVKELQEDRSTFRDETLRFVSDPQIFSDICSVICDSIYDYLHGEGFLDLPATWTATSDRELNTPDL